MASLLPFLHEQLIEAGCDEAGRGCLCGPVVAAAVILPDGFYHPLLNDSKKLTDKQREKLRPIIEDKAISWAVGTVDNLEIDQINILQASILAMHKAVAQLTLIPQHLLIDGNRFKPYPNIPHTCVIKGDGKYMSIAAASILAKTHRDEMMLTAHAQYPHYSWDKNMGYPTAKHREAIAMHGTTPLHRMSFQLIPDKQLCLF